MHDIYQVAGTIADRSGWDLSNLSLQKLTYIAQMMHLGETGTPLFADDFEAWDYGPVVPRLYHDLKMFGSDPVAPYSRLRSVSELAPNEATIVDQVVELGKQKRPGQLVAITHWDQGAWAKVYAKHRRGLVIPKALIKSEYDSRVQTAA